MKLQYKLLLPIILIGLFLGFLAVRSVINPPNRAQTPQTTLTPTAGACRLMQAVCSVDPADVPAGAQFRLKILANSVPVITGNINQTTVAIAQAVENTKYQCAIEIIDAAGTPYPAESCVKTVDAQYSCSNCSCKDWGELNIEELADRSNDPATYIRAKWTPVDPTPNSCPDDAQNCNEIRVFADKPNPPYNDYLLKYSCDANPVPTVRLHQANEQGTRLYQAVAFNKSGQALDACLDEYPFSCADIPACSLKEINYSGQYVERVSGSSNTELITVPGSICSSLCNFTLSQNGVDIDETSSQCVNLNEQLDVRYTSSGTPVRPNPLVNFNDDRDGDIWNQLPNLQGVTNHTYKDAGIYEIKLNCDPEADTVRTEFYCVKRLTIACGGGGGPTPTLTPSPTPAACPAAIVNITLPVCADCLVPSATPKP